MDKVLTISLIITAIYASLKDGMIFFNIRLWLEKTFPNWLHKPIFECLICMGGIWTLILYPILYQCIEINTIFVMLQVIGLNVIITNLISKMYD